MADIQILFSQPMVRAIMREIEQPGTGKTQSRRVFKGIERQPNGNWHVYGYGGGIVNVGEDDVPSVAVDFAPYHVGDRLYVREAWRTAGWLDGTAPRDLPRNVPMHYEAEPVDADNLPLADGRFRQARHMPRWASRITLTVTDVRVQRLQEISEADAIAEGAEVCRLPGMDGGIMVHTDNPGVSVTPGRWYRQLWDSLNAKRGYGWDTNLWVVAVTFDPVRRNIDQPESA